MQWLQTSRSKTARARSGSEKLRNSFSHSILVLVRINDLVKQVLLCVVYSIFKQLVIIDCFFSVVQVPLLESDTATEEIMAMTT